MYERDVKGGVGGRGADNSDVLYTEMKMSKDKFNKMEKIKSPSTGVMQLILKPNYSDFCGFC